MTSCDREACACTEEASVPDLGDLVVLLLTGTLSDLRDRLYEDGYCRAADLVADLVEITDSYVTSLPEA